MSGRVEGKRALVIGAGSIGVGMGNGKAAALAYAREGATVLAVDRNGDAAQETVDLITQAGGVAYVFAADMTDPEQVEATAKAAQEKLGGLDILHFNIGTSDPKGVQDTSLEDWRRVFSINIESAFMITKATLPMLEQDGGGSIVYISSLAAIRSGLYAYASYEASKAALCRFSLTVAMEYAARGIRSNVILPGTIETPHVEALIEPGTDREALARARAAMVPMRRQGSAWDIAETSVFLASDAAGYITGVELPIDGGLSMTFAQQGKSL